MINWKALFAILAISLLTIPEAALSQSLGQIARELRKECQDQPHKTIKVYTNDNITKLSRPETGPPTKARARRPEPNTREAKPSPTPPPPQHPAGKEIKTREYWETLFRHAHAALARAKEEQQLVEDELSLLQVRQVRELNPNLSRKLSEQESAKATELEVKRRAARKAQEVLEQLNKEFKESGAPEAWRSSSGLH